MKATAMALLLALAPTMAQADTETNLARTKQLEKAIRLQTLTTQAVRQGDYDLACKSQKEATEAIHEANVVDVTSQSDMQFAEICNAKTVTKSWLIPKYTTDFEPAGVFVVESN
jgi:hypothetical protein